MPFKSDAREVMEFIRGGRSMDALDGTTRVTVGRLMEDTLIDNSIKHIGKRALFVKEELAYVVSVDGAASSSRGPLSTSESLLDLNELLVRCGFVVQGCDSQVRLAIFF
jgi:hypothetical protein